MTKITKFLNQDFVFTHQNWKAMSTFLQLKNCIHDANTLFYLEIKSMQKRQIGFAMVFFKNAANQCNAKARRYFRFLNKLRKTDKEKIAIWVDAVLSAERLNNSMENNGGEIEL